MDNKLLNLVQIDKTETQYLNISFQFFLTHKTVLYSNGNGSGIKRQSVHMYR